MPARIPWILRDLTTDPVEEYPWEVNPNTFSSGRSKTLTYQATSATDGRAIVFEGVDKVQTVDFSGTMLSEAQYNELSRWFNKRNQVELEDDLGRIFVVYFIDFSVNRKRSSNYPWKHEYNGKMIVLDWPS